MDSKESNSKKEPQGRKDINYLGRILGKGSKNTGGRAD